MPDFVDLFCGCSFPSVARPSPRVLDGVACPEPMSRAVSSRASPGVQFRGRRSGMVPACLYEADPSDPIDMQLSWHLSTIDRLVASNLMLQKLSVGEYDIDGRLVSLRWGSGGPYSSAELVVCEGGAEDESEDMMETPVVAYLRQVADVAASLGGHCAGVPAVVRVPQANRLTFVDAPPPAEDELEGRVKSMRVAVEQARLRQHAAEMYERAESQYASLGSTSQSNFMTVRGMTTAISTVQVPAGCRSATPSPPPSRGRRIVKDPRGNGLRNEASAKAIATALRQSAMTAARKR